MNFQRWNVGLDIQPGKITALGLQSRRGRWQLRHWWQHCYHCPEADPLDIRARQPMLVPLLQHWKTLLPARFSLRVGLPPHMVLCREMPLPAQTLREPECGRYLHAAVGQLFPEGTGPLTVDYPTAPESGHSVAVTVASQEVLKPWYQLFRQAGLTPSVFELMPASLGVALAALPPTNNGVVIYCSAEFWLWAISHEGDIRHGWQYRQHYPDAMAVCEAQCPDAAVRFFCSDSGLAAPPGFRLFQPLSAISHRYPPQPVNESSFALATGLALRAEDGL